MRVLFTTFPWASHHYTMVPLAWAFRAAGHEVVVASTQALESTITASGLPAVSVGKEVDLAGMSKGPRLANWHEERLAGLQFAMADAMVDDLVDFSRAWRPDLVVHNTVSFAGPVAAAVLGVPSISHHWGGPGLHRVEMRRLGSEPLPGYVALFERFGAPVRSPSVWIDMCPESLRIPTSFPCLEMRYIPYNGPGTMPDWVLEGLRHLGRDHTAAARSRRPGDVRQNGALARRSRRRGARGDHGRAARGARRAAGERPARAVRAAAHDARLV